MAFNRQFVWLTSGLGLAVAIGLASAAYLAFGRSTPLDTMLAATGSLPIEGRLAGAAPPTTAGTFRSSRHTERGGRTPLAPELLITAATIAKRAAASPTPANLHANGVADLALGDVEASIADFERAAASDSRSASIVNDLSVAWLARSDQSGRLEDTLRALSATRQALSLAPRMPEALYNLAVIQERLHLADSSRQTWQRYLEEVDAPHDGWNGIARRRHAQLTTRTTPPPSLSDIFASLDAALAGDDETTTSTMAAAHPDAARSYVEERVPPQWAAAAAERDRDRVLRHAHLMASTSTFRDDPHTRDIVRWLHDAKPDAATSEALRRLADAATLVRDDRFTEVAAALGTSPAVLSRLRSPLAPIAIYYEAMPAVQRGDFRTGMPQLEAAKASTASAGYAFWQGIVLNRLGQILGRDGDQQRAIRMREEALVQFARARSDDQIAVMHSMIAECDRYLGDVQAAWRHHAEALGKLPIDNYRSRHLVIVQAGLTAAFDRRWDAGDEFHSAVIANALQWQRASALASGFQLRARSRYQAGEIDAAKRDLVEAERWAAQIPDRDFRERIGLDLLEVKGEVFAHDRPDAALTALNVAVDRFLATGFGARLAGLMYRRADVYRQIGRPDAAIADLQIGLDRLEQERMHVSEEQLRVTQAGALRQLALRLAELRLARSDDHDEVFRLVDLPRAQTLVEHLVGQHQPSSAWSLSQIRLHLPDDSVLLHYTVLRNRVLLWEIRRTDEVLHTLEISPSQLIDAVRQYRRALAGDAQREADYRSAAQALARQLLAPVRPGVSRARTLIIAPDGYLFGVAFPSLPLDDNTTLATNHDVLVVPSAGAFSAASAPMPASASALVTRRALITGVAAQGDGLGPLPWMPDEIAQVTRLYPDGLVLQDRHATKPAFLNALDRASVVHFAGHAAANPDRPLLSRLLLVTPDGRADPLYAYEIAHRDLRGAIVVLAACSTGFNDVAAEAENEGVLSLARGFLAAGATAVLASVVDVRDEDTAPLMVAFHTALSRGASPVSALRQALEGQRRAAEASPGLTWQSFVVIGRRTALGGVS